MQLPTAKIRPFLATLGAFALLAASPCSLADPAVLNFDTVTAGENGSLFPGNTFAAQGVTFTSGSIPNTVDAAGETFTLASIDNQLLVLGNNNNISIPNFAAASGVFGISNDLLMSFSIPVTSVQVTTDDASPDGGGAQIVRLLALAATANPNEFSVLAAAQGLDDATTSPANQLSVALATPFSFALFQVTTEAEGFDNLVFNAVPEPASFGFVALGLVLVAITLRRRGTRRLTRTP